MLLSGSSDTSENDNGVGNAFGLFEGSNTARKSKNSLPNAFVSSFMSFISSIAFRSVAFIIAVNFSFLAVLSRVIAVASSECFQAHIYRQSYLPPVFRFNNKTYFHSNPPLYGINYIMISNFTVDTEKS